MSGQATLVRAREVVGRPVVTIDGGEDAAEIKDVVYDATRHHLIGFTLNKRGWFRGSMKTVLPADSIEAIGADAVMVQSDDALAGDDDRSVPLAAVDGNSDGNFDVIGVGVMSSNGVELGSVVDVIVETGVDPLAVGYEVATGDDTTIFVPTSAQMALSDNHLIIPAEADDFVANDLTGFGASVESFRQLISNGPTEGSTS